MDTWTGKWRGREGEGDRESDINIDIIIYDLGSARCFIS